MCFKQGIDGAVVRDAQRIASWLGLAAPRDFPKPSYFLLLGLAPPSCLATGHNPTTQLSLFLGSRPGMGVRHGLSYSLGHSAMAPWCPPDEDTWLKTRPIPSSGNICP